MEMLKPVEKGEDAFNHDEDDNKIDNSETEDSAGNTYGATGGQGTEDTGHRNV